MARDILREFQLEKIDLEPRAEPEPAERLSRWLVGSLVFHALLILGLFFSPLTPEPGTREFPVYSVDLIGGEKLGGGTPGGDFSPVPAPKRMATPRLDADSAKREAKPKAIAKREAAKAEKAIKEPAAKVETRKSVEREPVARDAVALKATKPKEPANASTREEKMEGGAESGALDSVRERLMQAAVERAKSRNESAQRSSKGDGGSGGPGQGEGAAALGKGGRGGGTVRGIEFIAYQSRVRNIIRENWAWAGQRVDLKLTVHFAVKDGGEISGLKVVQPSGDSSYDESVLRALRKSSPLPPPPEEYRKDFADYTITFTPKDLGA